MKKQKQNNLQEAFEKFCKKHSKSQNKNKINKKIKSLEKQVEAAQHKYKTALAELNTHQLLLQNIDTVNPDIVRSNLESIQKHPDVDQVILIEDALIVKTKKIYIQKTCVGIFTIVMPAGGKITIHNLDEYKRSDGGRCYDWYDHPHVYQGEPCFGNIKNNIQAAKDANKWQLVVSMCIEFLKTYTEKEGYHAFAYLDRWKIEQSAREKKFLERLRKQQNTKANKEETETWTWADEQNQLQDQLLVLLNEGANRHEIASEMMKRMGYSYNRRRRFWDARRRDDMYYLSDW